MAELTLDIFNGDAFSAASMTGYVNENVPYVPGYFGSLGLFLAEGVYTTVVGFDDVNGALKLIQSSPRGAAPSQSTGEKAATRYLETVRFAREAVITADQIKGIRVPGTTNLLQSAERLVYRRVEGPTGIRAELSMTMEHLYLGAIDGQVYDADGTTVLWDYFTTYGVARPATVNVPFGSFTADEAKFDDLCMKIKRDLIKALNGFNLAGMTIVVACGDDFFDAVRSNKEVVNARKLGLTGVTKAPELFASQKAYSSFQYADIVWVNYRGSDDGKVSVPADEARLFALGVPGLFKTFFAPGDTWDTIEGEGLPVYMLQRPERQTSSQRAFEVQSNPLPMCLRPKSLRRLKKA